LLLAVLLSGLLTSCSGDSGLKPLAPIVKDNVLVLPDDGTVQIVSVTDTSLTMTGDVPALQAGDVIVSGEGQGLLRKVVASRSTTRGDVEIDTLQGMLEDVFQQADISLQKDLVAGDFSVIESTYPGVTIEPSPAASSTARDIFDELLVKFINIPITDQVTLTAEAKVRFGMSCDIQIDQTGLRQFRFVPTINVKATGKLEGKLTVAAYPLRPLFAHLL